MLILPHKNTWPRIARGVYLAENATVIGDVEIGAESSVWFQTVLRGDVGPIRIGKRSNIQDGSIVHCSTGRTPTMIGDDVTVGHAAILHGCTIEGEALIGMGAVVMDEVLVPRHCIVGARALVLEGTVLESGFLYAGSPARKVKALSEAHLEMIRYSAEHYVEYAREYRGK